MMAESRRPAHAAPGPGPRRRLASGGSVGA